MAKELTELGRLNVEIALPYVTIKTIHITDAANEHGQMNLCLIAAKMLTGDDLLPLENTPVKVTDPDGDNIFTGICQSIGIANQADYTEINITAKSLSMMTDCKKHTRTFQHTAKKFSEIANAVTAEYHIKVAVFDDITIEQMLYQNNETDWAFLRRIANQFSCYLFTDSKSGHLRIAIGTIGFARKILGPESYNADLSKDMDKYVKIRENVDDEAAPFEFEQTHRITYDLNIGAGYLIERHGDRPHFTVKSEISAAGETITNKLCLVHKEGCRPASYLATAALRKSDFIKGTVLTVSGTDIKVHFCCDESQSEATAMWIPFENVMNNYIYSMPDEGDTVFVYYENNGKAIALGSRRGELGANKDYHTTADKSLTSTNKMLRFTPGSAHLVACRQSFDQGGGNQSVINCSDDDGITIYTTQNINIIGDHKIIMQAADERVEVKTFAAFEARHQAGENEYIAHGGSPAANPPEEIKDNIGNDINATLQAGVADAIGPTPGLVKHIKTNMTGGGTSSNETAQAEEKKEDPRPPEGSLHLLGMNKCTFEVEDSELELTPKLIKITTPAYRQLGFNRGNHQTKKLDEEIAKQKLDPIDMLQMGLDLIGIIPVLGSAADLINAGIYAARGDKTNAALSLICCIPMGGKAIGTGMKIAAATAKASKLGAKAKNLKKLSENLAVVKSLTNGAVKIKKILKSEAGIAQAATSVRTMKHAKVGQRAWELVHQSTNGAVKTGKTSKAAAKQGQAAKRHAPKPLPKNMKGNQGKIPTGKGEPVNIVTGSYYVTMTDIYLKDLGQDFTLTRTYESIHENPHQPLGSRWLLNIATTVDVLPDEARILMDDLRIEKFEKIDGCWHNKRRTDQEFIFTEDKDAYHLTFAKHQKTYTYNKTGKLTTITYNNENKVKIDYQGAQIRQITLANGKILTFTYNQDKITKITDWIGRSVKYSYQGQFLTEVLYPNDGLIRYQYNPEGQITQITDQNGIVYLKNSYDCQGRVIHQEMQKQGEYLFFYQEDDRMNTVVSPHNKKRERCVYNRQHLVTKTLHDDGTTEETDYDDNENIIRAKDRNGNEIHRKFNNRCQLIEEHLPNGLIKQYTYDENGNLCKESDNYGAEKQYTYDNHNNLCSEKQKLDDFRWQTITYTHDAKGRKTSQTDALGNTTRYDYDENAAQPCQITTPTGDTFYYHRDEAERTMSIESPLGIKEYGYNHLDYQVMEIDALGNTTKYEYDKLGNLVKEIKPNQYNDKSHTGNSWQYRYDAMDHLEQITDPLGSITATPRDAEENIIKEINPNTYDQKTNDGQGIKNFYDQDNNKIKIIYPDGGIERIKYDSCGNEIKRIKPEDYDESTDDGKGYTYQYDEMNRLTKITDSQNHVQKCYHYDLRGNIIKETDSQGYPENIGTLYHYNKANWLIEKRIPLHKTNETVAYQVTQYHYDLNGNITEERRLIDEQDETSSSGRILTIDFTYDKQNRLISVTDNTGAVIEYTYNCLNQKTSERRKINDQTYQTTKYKYDEAARLIETSQKTDKEGTGSHNATTKYTLDKTGNVIKITTPAGYIIKRQYDDADRLITEIQKDKENKIENTTLFTYDKAGNITKITDTNGAEEQYHYDLLNRQTKHTAKNGGITRTIYDKNGRITKKILPNEYQQTAEESNGYQYTYDKLGRILSIIAPDGKLVETNIYDEHGRLMQKLDANQSGVTYEYDINNRTKTIKTMGGTSQSYEYDAQGNITGIIDGNHNRTEYHLDNWGRITTITKADGTNEYFAYDYAGNITETTDGEGNKITYEYNLINRLKEITDQTGEKDCFSYDSEGRIKNHIDRNGNRVSYNYNIYGSLTEKIEQNTGLSQIYEYHTDGTLKAAIAQGMRYGYSYYADGRLKEKTASGKTLLAYEYDLNGNKIRQSDVTGKTTDYLYNEMDLLTEITDEGNKTVSFSHNEDGTIKTVMNANGMNTVYDYDIDKNISGLNIELNGQTLARNSYTYDGNGNRTVKQQLRGTTTYTYDDVNRLIKAQYLDCQEELFYDRTGNRTRRIVSGIEEQYQYDVRNRLTSHVKQGVETQYQYDNAGNMLNDGDKQYSYDGFNRTTKIETKDGKIQTNKYDAEGLRYEIEENSKLVQFIFNENKEVVVEQTDENLKRLIRSFDLWASECAREKTWYHYASDEQGSTIFVADDEEICNRYEYDAFGNAVVCEETVENRYKYTGQQFDPITQQYYLRARYYNPIIARFTQEDEYRGDGLNLYAYCDNNPVMYYDPSGYACDPGTKDAVGKRNAINYGELDNLGRPTGINATITKDMIGTGSKASQSIKPPGFEGGGPGSPGHARGHILGKQLGGDGKDPRNLVTLYQNPVNSPIMRDFENSIRAAVEKGEIVNYSSMPIYKGDNLIPSGVTMNASGSGGFNLNVTVLNRK